MRVYTLSDMRSEKKIACIHGLRSEGVKKAEQAWKYLRSSIQRHIFKTDRQYQLFYGDQESQETQPSPLHLEAPAQMCEQYSISGRMEVLYKYKRALGGMNFLARDRQPTRIEADLAIPEIYLPQLRSEEMSIPNMQRSSE